MGAKKNLPHDSVLMDLGEADAIIKRLAGMFEATDIHHLASGFREYGGGATMQQDQVPNLDARYRTLGEQVEGLIVGRRET